MTIEGLAQDLRQAARALVRRPGFSVLTVLTLALGIGSATAIFSAVNTVLLRPLPYAEPEQVVVLFRADVDTGERSDGVSAQNMRDYRERSALLSDVAVAEPWSQDLRTELGVESLRAWTVSPGFFRAIGADAMLGRTLGDADYDAEAPVVVLSHRTWTNRFGSDPSALGSTVVLDGVARTVVGVMPPEYRFPDASEVWIPRIVQPWDESSRAADFMVGVARLAPGATLEQVRSEADRIAEGLRAEHPEINADLAYDVVALREHLLGDVRTPLYVLMAAVLLVLMIACANVAGLIMARGAQREGDFALRGALGAGTSRLVSTVAAEGLLLAIAGCVAGVGLAFGGLLAIRALGPDHLPRIEQLSVDGRVLLFAVAASAASALLSALAPSMRLSRPDLRGALGDGARGSSRGRLVSRARGRLVVAQVASAVVLLTGAGLLLRSFGALLDKELGFDPTGRLAAQIFAYDYASTEDAAAVVEEALANMRALPGVTGAAVGSDVPAATDGVIAKIDITLPFVVADRPAPPAGQEPLAVLTRVSPGFFDVLGMPILEGRPFQESDDASSTPVVVVNEALARRHFGDADPIGERLFIGANRTSDPSDSSPPRSAPEFEIVGVVADTRPLGHASEPRPELFVPLRQSPTGSLVFVVHAAQDAGALTRPVMEAVWAANPAQSVYGSATMESLVEEWLKERRFNLFLLSAFSVIAVALSAVGLYGLVSFSVERRVGELGIRRALGGRSATILALVLRQGIRLAGTGLLLGLAAAWYLSRFIRGWLVDVEPTDPVTLVGLGGVVLLVALAATLVPALRAVRVDPAASLRSE